MKKYGKKYVEASKNVDKTKVYNAEDAIKLVKTTSTTKFDSTVEVALKLNVDSKKADQQLKGSLSLPHGTGKTKTVLVIAKGVFAEEAKAAGADFVGDKDMIDKIKNENWFGFDVVVATPDMMPEVGKIGNILGPRNLMPNPKTGTVTTKVGDTVKDIKKGMVTYKNDKFGNVHTHAPFPVCGSPFPPFPCLVTSILTTSAQFCQWKGKDSRHRTGFFYAFSPLLPLAGW